MTKTEFLLIGSRQRLSTLERNPIIEINKFLIKHVSTSKSLGVHIDGNLSWECHISEISKKVASGISAIKRIRYFLPFEILLNVYNSLVQPHFDYCNVVWGNCSKNLSSKLQKLQNRAARVLTFSNYDCSTSELFQNLKWSKLVHQRAVRKAIMMHCIVNNTAPEYLTSRLFVAAIQLAITLGRMNTSSLFRNPVLNFIKEVFLIAEECYGMACLWRCGN